MMRAFRHLFISLSSFTIGYSQTFSLADRNVKAGQFQHLYDIHFELGSSKLQSTGLIQLDSLIEFLKNNPTSKIELGVHTDFRGDDRQNLDLSKSRAKTNHKYLIEKGIATNRFRAIGFGETKPVIEYEKWESLIDSHRCGYYGRGNRRETIVVTSV
jgi:outer membrane protein OmpA-like peptidoglycan-associated protein